MKWAADGIRHLSEVAFQEAMEWTLDIPEHLLSGGLQLLGVKEESADLAAGGTLLVATLPVKATKKALVGGVNYIRKGGLRRGWEATKGFFGKVKGFFSKGGCFPAGTLVALAGPVAALPIEDIELGALVVCEEEAPYRLPADDLQLVSLGYGDSERELDEVCWTRLDLAISDVDGREAFVSLLRPDWWISQRTSISAGSFFLNLPKQGLVGVARVLGSRSMESPLLVGERGNRPVTGLFTRTANELVVLDLAGTDEDIRTTPQHLFYTRNRCTWIPAGAVLPGEVLQGVNGDVVVAGVTTLRGAWVVHNLEVLIGSTYRVGELAVLVHNDYDCKSAAKGGDWAKLSGKLRGAANGKGNFGIGSGTREQAGAMGEAWVGSGFRTASNGKTLISADGLRQFRPPLLQAELEQVPGQL